MLHVMPETSANPNGTSGVAVGSSARLAGSPGREPQVEELGKRLHLGGAGLGARRDEGQRPARQAPSGQQRQQASVSEVLGRNEVRQVRHADACEERRQQVVGVGTRKGLPGTTVASAPPSPGKRQTP